MKPLEEQLKEIRDKYDNDMNSTTPYNVELPYSVIMKIQSETYNLADKKWQSDYDNLLAKYELLLEDKLDAKQLGRDEVIEEIENAITEHFKDRYTNGTKFINVKIILSKLTELKEQK